MWMLRVKSSPQACQQLEGHPSVLVHKGALEKGTALGNQTDVERCMVTGNQNQGGIYQEGLCLSQKNPSLQ